MASSASRPSPFSAPSVLWLQVAGLALMQTAITLTWVIYNFYLVDLLTAAGWSAGVAVVMLAIENALAVILEPLMGLLADGQRRWVGHQMPLVAVGTLGSAALFLAIPAVAGLRWLLPALMVLWAIAMTTFRSPVISLLGQYARSDHLPQATSLLTLVGATAGALRPYTYARLLDWGPEVAFVVGSVVLVGAGLGLRLCQPTRTVTSAASPPRMPLSWLALGCVGFTGCAVGLGVRCLFTVFPASLVQQQPDLSATPFLTSLFVTQILVALPLGTLARQVGSRRCLGGGLMALALLVGLAGLASLGLGTGVGVALGVALGTALTLVFNGAVPFALGLVASPWFGLATGLYFGGWALANALAGPGLAGAGLGQVALVGAVALGLGAVAVGLSTHLPEASTDSAGD